MTTQVLCVMENHASSSPYYPLESTIFSSGSDENEESSESTIDSSLNLTLEEDQKQQLEKLNTVDQRILLLDASTSNEDGATQKKRPKYDFQNYLSTVRRIVIGIVGCAAQSGIGLLDLIVSLCTNRGVQNVVMVTLTVAVEVFVIMVFAVATILATIIINIDDAYRSRDGGRKIKRTRSEHIKGTPSSLRVKMSKSRLSRREKISHRSPRASKLNIHVLDTDGIVSETEDLLFERCSHSSINKCFKASAEIPPEEGTDFDAEIRSSELDTNDSLKCLHSINLEEVNESEINKTELAVSDDTNTEAKSENSKANVSPPVEDSENRVTNKQVTIYRNKLLTIQDSSMPKKISHRAPKSTQLFMGKDVDDGAENKEHNKDEAVAIPNEGTGNDGEVKERTIKSVSITLNSSPTTIYDNVETDSMSITQLSLSQCSEENSNGDTLSFVSTKRIFENNSKS